MIGRGFDSETTTAADDLTVARTDGFAIQNGDVLQPRLLQRTADRVETVGARAAADARPACQFHLVLSVASPAWMYPPSLVAGGETTGSWLRSTPDFDDRTWRAQNARRGELLLKRLQGQLSMSEALELERLQRVAEQRAESSAARSMSALAHLPLPPPGMDRIVEPPAE